MNKEPTSQVYQAGYPQHQQSYHFSSTYKVGLRPILCHILHFYFKNTHVMALIKETTAIVLFIAVVSLRGYIGK
jgi:hypothetical protein